MSSLTIREKNLLLGALTLLIIVLSVVYIILPRWRSYQEISMQLESASQQLTMLQNVKHQIEQGESTEAIRAKLYKSAKTLPNSPETAELVFYLQKATIGRGVSLKANIITDPTDVPNSPVKATVAHISINGSYDGINKYLIELEKFPRALWVDQVNIVKPAPPVTGLEAEIQLKSFFLPFDAAYKDEIIPQTSPAGKVNPF